MKYLVAIKNQETNEVDMFGFDNEFDREDFASHIMETYYDIEVAYTQDDWVVNGEQILYCYTCIPN